MHKNNFENKVILVTGAGSGIGEALAKKIGALGAKVICVARTKKNIDKLSNHINRNGGNSIPVVCDATKLKDMEKLAEKINKNFSSLHLAFLNAGGNIYQESIEKSDLSKWQEALNLNMLPLFLGIKICAPLMRKAGGGNIVLTGSAMAHYASKSNSSYSAGKAAARIIANTASFELMEDNIIVNEFIPGPVRTKQALKNYSKEDKSSPFNNPNEWVKDPNDVVDLILHMFSFPTLGPTSQIFSLARR
ncbi:MAG: hypothetical protein CMP24_07335 [Rickettsiales bacterium]|nr:hypothetical protein [Rickettsiales bacterium]